MTVLAPLYHLLESIILHEAFEDSSAYEEARWKAKKGHGFGRDKLHLLGENHLSRMDKPLGFTADLPTTDYSDTVASQRFDRSDAWA